MSDLTTESLFEVKEALTLREEHLKAEIELLITRRDSLLLSREYWMKQYDEEVDRNDRLSEIISELEDKI